MNQIAIKKPNKRGKRAHMHAHTHLFLSLELVGGANKKVKEFNQRVTGHQKVMQKREHERSKKLYVVLFHKHASLFRAALVAITERK